MLNERIEIVQEHNYRWFIFANNDWIHLYNISKTLSNNIHIPSTCQSLYT